VVIGVAAVIALVSVGEGASALITSQIQGLGTNLLVILPANSRVNLTVEDADRLAARLGTVSAVAPQVTANVTVKWGLNSHATSLNGITPAHLEVRGFEVQSGRFVSDGDLSLNRRVAVIGSTVVLELFQSREPLGQELSINGQRFTIVGVLTAKGDLFGQDQDNLVMIPLTSAQRLVGNTRLSMIYASLASGDLATITIQQVKDFFTRTFGRADQVRVQSQDQLLGTIRDATRVLSLMLGAIAGISLLVGGIGIMNIMLVSVTERTREIGLRKAVGARRGDILAQFLLEATMISLFGGIVGIGIGSLAASAIARFGGWDQAVSSNAVLVSFAFAAAVGVLFGIYPAIKASRLDPIQALRYE
jgi:putative ABC transport system permease protein